MGKSNTPSYSIYTPPPPTKYNGRMSKHNRKGNKYLLDAYAGMPVHLLYN